MRMRKEKEGMNRDHRRKDGNDGIEFDGWNMEGTEVDGG